MDNRAFLGGLALGAAAAFTLDPDRGARRRALMRDKLVRGSRITGDALDATMKDMTNRANKPTMAEVGEGNLNWPSILAAAKEAGVQWYIIEQDVCERDAFESLGISLRNLKSWGLK